MSCLFRIAGRKLDVDELLLKTNLQGFSKVYKSKDYKEGDVPTGKQYSFVSINIGNANMYNVEKQVSDVVEYLRMHIEKLAGIKNMEGVEYATLNFLVKIKSISNDHFEQYIYFQKELLELCGYLGIGIEVTLVN